MSFIFLKKIKRFLFKEKNDYAYKPVVLITGCGSGIGWALTKLLYTQKEYRVAITARKGSLKILNETFPENDRFKIFELDVTSEYQRETIYSNITALWGGVDILVNNAGISYRSAVEHMTENDEFMQMRANYFGPMGLIRLCIPAMRKRGRGKIISVSSVSGMLAMPTMASYSASKYALEGASEALWYEMRPLGINVSLVQPGFVKSQSFRNVYFTEKSNPANAFEGPYSDLYFYMAPFIERMMNLSPTSPASVAKKILKIIKKENPPLWVPATFDAIVFYYLKRLMPRRWLLPFLFYCLPKSSTWAKDYTKKRAR